MEEEFEFCWSNLECFDLSLFDEEILLQPPAETNTTNASEEGAKGLMNKLERTKISRTNSSKPRKSGKKKIINENAAIEGLSPDEGGSSSKKLDHNAKERIRRMRLNASYLALRALLPDSRRSKKKWTAPAIVDRVLKYIPELENEVEELRSTKKNHVEKSQAKLGNPIPNNAGYESPTISLNRVNEDEAIIQVCIARKDESQFTNLLQSVEDEEGICIKTASMLYISQIRICCHLHIQTNKPSSEADDQFQELLDKVASWLNG